MAFSLDFAMGVLILSSVAALMAYPIALWQFLLGVLAFVPDIDIALLLLIGRKDLVPFHHTLITHRPLVVIPLITAIAWYFFGPFWTVVTFVCLTYHFLHDTKGFGGAGIMWFWPFSKKEWSLRGAEESTQHLNPQLDDWLAHEWLRPSETSLREIGIGALALSGGMYITYGVCTAFMFATLALATAFAIWWMHADR